MIRSLLDSLPLKVMSLAFAVMLWLLVAGSGPRRWG